MKNMPFADEKLKIIAKAIKSLEGALEKCELCPRKCGVDRLKGEKGFCNRGEKASVYSYASHHGEEPAISGRNGSGTIFFARCNMGCVYCQNYTFSQTDAGEEVSERRLADMMIELEQEGCHNINLVTPTHFVPQILGALRYAFADGLNIPIVYNTSGYDSVDVIRVLDGIMDIYLPDMRYSSDIMAEKYSNAPAYVMNNRLVIEEMYRQAGKLVLEDDIAVKGLIIRLLVLPNGISGTLETLEFINKKFGIGICLSVMCQYYPAYKAPSIKELIRRVTRREYSEVASKIGDLGFATGWVQEFEGEFDDRFAGENFSPKV